MHKNRKSLKPSIKKIPTYCGFIMVNNTIPLKKVADNLHTYITQVIK